MSEAGFVGVREAAELLGVKPSLLSLRIFRDPEIKDHCVIERGKRLIPAALLPDLQERFASSQPGEVSHGQD